MSRLFNELTHATLESITDALVSAVSQAPSTYRPLGRALARAVERYLASAHLVSYGQPDEAAVLLNHCMRHLNEALHICETEHVTMLAEFMQVATALPTRFLPEGEA